MFSPSVVGSPSVGMGVDSSADLQRKLAESQERQAIILRKIAEKERKLDLAHTSSASALAASSMNLSSASAAHVRVGSPVRDPLGMRDTSTHFTLTAHTHEDKFGSPIRQTTMDFSIHDERLNQTLLDDESAMLRVRQLATQLRQSKSDNARKDILVSNLQQQVADLSRTQSEYTSARSSWESREQQFSLQASEYASHITELQNTIKGLTLTEQQLRAAQGNAQKEQLSFERSATVQLGDMDAKIHSLRAELEAKTVAMQQAQYEASLAQRETERVTASARAFESTQLQIQQAMEEKFFSLKRDHAALEEQMNQMRATNARLVKEAQEREEQLEARDTELHIHARAKASQSALVESLTRELADVQADHAALKKLADQVPTLKSELAALQDVRQDLRASQSMLVTLEGQHHSAVATLDGAQAENAGLKSLVQQLERSLTEVRDRYSTLVAPGGELETVKTKHAISHEEAEKQQTRADQAEADLARSRQEADQLDAHIDAFHNYAVVLLNNVHRGIDAGMNGSGEDQSGSEEVPAFVRESVRTAAANLRSGVRAAINEFAHLRVQNAELLTQLGDANKAASLRSGHVVELEAAVREADTQLARAEERRLHEVDAGIQALERVAAELHQQREEATAARQHGDALATELDERTVIIRLWAVELESLARSMQPSGAPADERSILGGSAASTLAEHWPSVRSAFGEVLFLLSGRARALVQELADCERSRQQQRQDLARVSEEVATVTAQLQQSTEGARDASRQASAALADSESLRLSEAQRLTDECNMRCETLQTSYEKIIAEVQEQNRKNTQEIITLTRNQHNLLTATRLFYKGFKPVWTRLQEVTTQKAVLTKLYHSGLREHQEVRDLMLAMTGNSGAPDGVRLLPNGKRALFRAGVIAVLAFRRFLTGPRRQNSYGQMIQVRGEQFSLLDNQQLSNDANLPVVDDSSLSVSAQSLVHLLAHFEPFSEVTRGHRSLLDRITTTRFTPSRSGSSQGEEDRSDMAVIRRVALTLANRNRQLERDVQLSVTEAWTAKEQAKALCDEMTHTHEQMLRLAQDATENEKRRVAQLEHEFAASQANIRRLEEAVTTLSTQKSQMVSAAEYTEVRVGREEYARRVRELESDFTTAQRQLASEKERHELTFSTMQDGLESKLTLSSKRLQEQSEENTQLQVYLRKKTNELATMERSLKDAADLQSEMQHNLESCMSKNTQLIDRVKVIEAELQEHRTFSHKLKSTTLQYDANKHQWELTLAHLQSEIREKERELSKSQDLIRTLTAATRAATNELDTQLHIARQVVAPIRRTPMTAGVYAPPASFAHVSPYPQATPVAPLLLASPAVGATPAQGSHVVQSSSAVGSTIHLRHHPGGRLSMDVSGVGADGRDFAASVRQDAPNQTPNSNQLRFDELPPEAAPGATPQHTYIR